jgi:hypothetical protein
MSKDDVEVTQADRQAASAIYGFIRRELDDRAYQIAAAHRLSATPPSPPAMVEHSFGNCKDCPGVHSLMCCRKGSTSLTVPEPDKEVVERVARAIYLQYCAGLQAKNANYDLVDEHWKATVWRAKAIAALRPQVGEEG